MIVHRTALYFPSLVTHLFSICTPYHPPSKSPTPLSQIVASKLPNFGYQLQLASGLVEEKIQSKQEIKHLLNGMYGGKGPNGEVGFEVETGILFDNLPKLQQSRLMSEEVLDYYAEEYARNGMHGTRKSPLPLSPFHLPKSNNVKIEGYVVNWYRNREQNFKDESRYATNILPASSITEPLP